MIGEILLAFGTLFPIVNPFSTSFVFNKLTKKASHEKRKKIAERASITAFFVLICFLFVGDFILSFFGITIYAFRVAGGIYLGKVGFEMLGKNLRKDPESYEDIPDDISVIPLAIPLLSGPGAITSVLIMSEIYPKSVIFFAILAICIISLITLNFSKIIDKALGHTGTNVVERLLGLLVLVIAVQFVFNGITDYIGLL